MTNQPLGNQGKRAPRSRLRPEPITAISLQERDILLLTDLYYFGCMLRGQIETLYFGSVARTNARLRQLFDAKYVVKAALPLPRVLGSPTGCQAVYMLGPSGIPVVAGRTGDGIAEVRSYLRHGTPAFILHTLEIVEFRLAVLSAIKAYPAIRVEEFLPERLCLQRYDYREQSQSHLGAAAPWRTEVYRPDAVMLLGTPSGRHGYAIEIDLGHTSSAELIKKLSIHTRYAASGLFLKRYGVQKTSTLVCTTTAKRRDNLKTLVEKQNSKLFWLTTFAEVSASGILSPIWHTPFSTSPAPLINQPFAIKHKGEQR